MSGHLKMSCLNALRCVLVVKGKKIGLKHSAEVDYWAGWHPALPVIPPLQSGLHLHHSSSSSSCQGRAPAFICPCDKSGKWGKKNRLSRKKRFGLQPLWLLERRFYTQSLEGLLFPNHSSRGRFLIRWKDSQEVYPDGKRGFG